MIVLDVAILNVAIPSIERTFGFSVENLQWLVTGYTLAFGGFLLLGGRASDLYGRKRVFIAGVLGFTMVSFLIGALNSGSLIVPMRVLQGFFAAFMSPAALSLVLTLFSDHRRRSIAISLWGAVSAGGATVALLLGGLLTQYLGWRWNFFVNVPIGIIVIAAAWRLLPAHVAEETDKTLDLPGAALVTSGLMLLVYTLTKANAWGWRSSLTVGLLALSVVLLAGFVVNEWVARHPLMPLSMFRIGNIAAANLYMLPVVGSLFSAFFFLTLYAQNILHYSPFEAGLAFLPMSLLIGVFAILAPRVLRFMSYRWLLVITPLFPAFGLFLLTYIPVAGSYATHMLPALLIMPIGMGLSFVATTVAATSGIPPQESGLASGLLTTSQQIGGSVGLAILTAISTSTITDALAGGASQAQAAVFGFHSAFYTGVVFALLASAMALFFLRRVPTSGEVSVVQG